MGEGFFDRDICDNCRASSSSTPLTSSTYHTHTIDGFHHFKINGYSLCKGLGTGKYIASDTFTVGGYSWEVRFFPDGHSPEDKSECVSLFLVLASEGTDVRALFGLGFMCQNGKHVHNVFDRSSGPQTFKNQGRFWGYPRLLKRSTLEHSDYLQDDCLLFCCSVGVIQSHTKGVTISVPPSNIGHHFGQLLESGKDADVSFMVDGETFAAHKLVLATRSPVFRALLFGPMRDQNTSNIEVKDMQAPIFKALPHFIYWDKLPDTQELVGVESKCGSTLMAQHLLAAADRYDIERLRLLCEAKLLEELNIDTVAPTLALAELHHYAQLKTACLKFISVLANLKAVIKTEGYKHLMKSCPSILAELLEYVAEIGEHSS